METFPQHASWKGTTGGTTWMQRMLVVCLGWMNLPLVYSGMACIIPFYMLFNHQGYISQYHFFRERMKYGKFKSFFSVYLNHFCFGQVILDRFAVYGGASFKVKIDGEETYHRYLAQQEGFVQLSSHVGNFELAGYMLTQDKKPISALVFQGETSTVMKNRARIFQNKHIRLISVGNDLAHVFAMNTAIKEGGIVSMPGDRNFGSQKSVACQFFGSKAHFPMGPFALAVTTGVPVLSIFVMKESIYQYRVYVNEVKLPLEVNGMTAKKKIELLAQEFAAQLEQRVRQYPYQWFNYYEFWNNQI